MILPVRTSKFEEDFSNAHIRNDINLRAILGFFMIGTGGLDVCRVLTIMSVVGGSGFQKGHV